MEEKNINLDPHVQLRIVKTIKIIFGIICNIVACYYFISVIGSDKSRFSFWVAIAFLLLFGNYQIMAGAGKTNKYISISGDLISFKQHSFLPCRKIRSADIKRIFIHPLSIIFYLHNGKKFKFRFGLSYPEIIDPVKQNVIEYSGLMKIPLKIVEEELQEIQGK